MQVALEQREVGVDHHPHQLLERGPSASTQLLLGLGGVADQQVDLGGAEEALVDDDVVLVVEADVAEGELAELADRWVSPVDTTKSSGSSCWSISHMAST